MLQNLATYCRMAGLAAVAAVDSWNLGPQVEVADAEVFVVARVLEAVAYGSEAPLDSYNIIIIFIDS